MDVGLSLRHLSLDGRGQANPAGLGEMLAHVLIEEASLHIT